MSVTHRHTVTCKGCGKQVTDLARTKTAIRKELIGKGWHVAVPAWADAPADEVHARRQNPALRGKTVDYCASCCLERQREAMTRLDNWHSERAQPSGPIQ